VQHIIGGGGIGNLVAGAQSEDDQREHEANLQRALS
jgi:hypothetical protein